jgi:Tol biopolymer transport system component
MGEPADLWRVPFLGGTPRLLISDVASSLAWAPDGQRIAFLRSRITPTLTTQLIVAAADGGQERALASDTAGMPIVSLIAPWRPNIPPAWSPDGRLIGVSAASPTGGRLLFVDSQSGSTQDVMVNSGTTSGLSWLDAESLVLNQPLQPGAPNQLFRLHYPTGSLSRLTNDPNDYVISLSSDRSGLVTGRRDARMDVWVGDGEASTGAEVVQRVPISIERLAWSGDRLLYNGFVGGRPTILRVTPGQGTPEEIVADALTPGVTSDGRTIVFVSSSADNKLDLWTADANGRRIAQLVLGVNASPVVVTPDDRSGLFSSIAGGTVSIWIVAIEGGTPTKLTDGASATVSPDGKSIAFTTQSADGRGSSLVVCSLPGCTSPRTLVRRHSIRRSPGLPTVVGSRLRGKGICGCSHSAEAHRVSSHASPTNARSARLHGRVTASAWPSRDQR